MIKYYPYKSDKPNKKYYIITNNNKKVYFGQAGASGFTIHSKQFAPKLYCASGQNIIETFTVCLSGSEQVVKIIETYTVCLSGSEQVVKIIETYTVCLSGSK